MSRKPGRHRAGARPGVQRRLQQPEAAAGLLASLATSAAHSGATALVPPMTMSLPSTRIW